MLSIPLPIRHFRNEKGTGTEMRPAIVSGIVTGDAPISFLPVACNSPRSLCKLKLGFSPLVFSKVVNSVKVVFSRHRS